MTPLDVREIADMAAKLRKRATEDQHRDMATAALMVEAAEAFEDLLPSEPLMTPKQYIDAIERLNLSQRSAGKFLGVDERTSRRWVSGESAIPESVAKLLRLMVKLKLSPEDVP